MAINYIEEQWPEYDCPNCGRTMNSDNHDAFECGYVCPDCDSVFDPDELAEDDGDDEEDF